MLDLDQLLYMCVMRVWPLILYLYLKPQSYITWSAQFFFFSEFLFINIYIFFIYFFKKLRLLIFVP